MLNRGALVSCRMTREKSSCSHLFTLVNPAATSLPWRLTTFSLLTLPDFKLWTWCSWEMFWLSGHVFFLPSATKKKQKKGKQNFSKNYIDDEHVLNVRSGLPKRGKMVKQTWCERWSQICRICLTHSDSDNTSWRQKLGACACGFGASKMLSESYGDGYRNNIDSWLPFCVDIWPPCLLCMEVTSDFPPQRLFVIREVQRGWKLKHARSVCSSSQFSDRDAPAHSLHKKAWSIGELAEDSTFVNCLEQLCLEIDLERCEHETQARPSIISHDTGTLFSSLCAMLIS